MRKEIEVKEARVGMRVVELDISWLKSPFWRNAFTIRNEKDLRVLAEYCTTIVIDLNESALSSTNHLRKRYSDEGQNAVKPGFSGKGQTKKPVDADAPEAGQENPEETLPARKKLKSLESHISVSVEDVKNVFADIRNGNAIDSDKLKESVTTLTSDVLEDSGSLLLLSRLKEKEQTLAEKSVNVCILTMILAKHLKLDKRSIRVLGLGALLHDIGMLKVPDNLMHHPGPLNKSQRAIIEQHVVDGVSFVGLHEDFSAIPELREMIGGHHERYDGSGYPQGLKGDRIPFFARILGLTTTYEAMTRERFFCETSSPTKALAKLYSWRSKLFDAELVEQFIQALGVYPPGCVVELEGGQIAVVTAINPDNRTRPVIRILLGHDQSMLTNQPELDLMMPALAHLKIMRTVDTNELDEFELPEV